MSEKKTVIVTLNMRTCSKVYLNNTKLLFVSHYQGFFFQYHLGHGEDLFVCFTSFFHVFKIWQLCSLFWLYAAPRQTGLEQARYQWASLEHLKGHLPQVTCLDKHFRVILQDWFKGEEAEMKKPRKDTSVVYVDSWGTRHRRLGSQYPAWALLHTWPAYILFPSICAWSTEDQTLG